MNILHVLSGDFVAGSETYAATLAERQLHRGHTVFIAAGNFTHATKATIFSVPIYKRDLAHRVTNTRMLIKIIRDEHVDIIHAHSRAASWVSYFAARITRTAYLSTLHGIVSLHLSSRCFNVFGSHCIAICENVQNNLLDNVTYYSPEKVHLVRNGIVL